MLGAHGLSWLWSTAATATLLAAIATSSAAAEAASPAVDYTWRNVAVGGGGYIPNVIFSPVAKGLAYARSDMGGAYRWDAAMNHWTPLQDGFSAPGAFGVESLAPDPKDADVVYAAVGDSHLGPAAMLRSTDRGSHWTVTPAPFRMGGNEDGRGLGERLAVDPSNTRILYFGSRFDGLQRSSDSGRHWTRVADLPVTPLPAGPGWRGTHAGLGFVLFVPGGETSGAATRTILVGADDPGLHHLFRSDDAGATWRAVDGGPDSGLLPMRAALDGQGAAYITYADGMGPNGITRGAVWKLDLHTGGWSDITPDRRLSGEGGYIGLTVDHTHPQTVMVASVDRWRPGDAIWRSTDGGRTWRDLVAISRRDVTATPFLNWGEPEAKFGWWITALAIDPFDPRFAVYGTGATLYATTALEDADRARSLTWRPWVQGIEQTAVLTLASPSRGLPLLSGFGDISGFAHTALDVSPKAQFVSPVFGNTNTIAIAAEAPDIVVRSGTPKVTRDPGPPGPRLAWSSDSGLSWSPLTPPVAPGDAAISVSADGRTFLVATPVPQGTTDRGATWFESQGLPAGTRPIADPTEAGRFYALDFAHAALFSSEDGARSFHASPTDGLPASLAQDEPHNRESPFPLLATPGRAGDLWLASRAGLFHSTDGGRRFAKMNGGPQVLSLSFGAPLKPDAPPALYAIATKNGLKAIWRSGDFAKTWVRINDDAHQYGQRFRAIAGDPKTPGRVYVATDGRGIVWGDQAPTPMPH